MAPRVKDEGLTYLRRSESRNELGMPAQLEFALRMAKELGVRLDATQADLEYMIRNKLHAYKSLRIDDSITGADMDRLGFRALMNDAQTNPRISHVFVYLRDRLARPEDAMAMAMEERALRYRGITF